MGIRAPYGNSNATLVDQLVGSAYDTVYHVSQNLNEIKHVSVHLPEIYRVAQSIEEIDNVVELIEKIDIVNANAEDITTVADNIASVNSVAAINAAVSTVAANDANVSTVAASITGVNTIAAIASEIETVAGLAAAIVIVNSNEDEIAAVAPVAAGIAALAPHAAAIGTLAASVSELAIVAGSIDDVNALGAIAPDLATLAGIVEDIETVAGMADDVSTFADIYQGAHADAPTLRNNGDALENGDLYFDTGLNAMQVYSGVWSNVAPVSGDTVDTVAALAGSAISMGSTVTVRGYHEADDGGFSQWRKSTIKGVRGRAMAEHPLHDAGESVPAGEYRVKVVGGGGRYATARVIIRNTVLSTYVPPWALDASEHIVDAIIIEPGENYTDDDPEDLPHLSQDPSDWFMFHGSDLSGNVGGATRLPYATFALADNRLSIRTAAGEEYLMQHDGRFPARSLGITCRKEARINFNALAVDTGADTITVPENLRSWRTGQRVKVSIFSGATLPAPLSASSYYFVRRLSSTQIALHTSKANALAAENTIDLTTVGTDADGNPSTHPVFTLEDCPDNEKWLQEAVISLQRGRCQIDKSYGGGPELGGKIIFPSGIVSLNGATIYFNSTGAPNGSELVGFGIEGIRPSPRPTRPDAANGGTQFQYGKFQIGNNISDSGVFEHVSRGISFKGFGLIGGMEWCAVQHSFEFSDALINPDFPIGSVVDDRRILGYGCKMRHCSTALIERVTITSGDQVYFGTDNELKGWGITDCDQLTFKNCMGSFCDVGFEFTYENAGEKNTNIKMESCTCEANRREDLIIEACRVFFASITTLGRNQQDSTLPRVRVGNSSANAECHAVKIVDGSFSGTPYLVAQPVYSTISTDRVTVRDDYSHRYVNGEQVIIADTTPSTPVYAIKTVSNVTYTPPPGNRRTTINVGDGVTSDIDTIIKVGNEAEYSTSVSRINATTIQLAGVNLASRYSAGEYLIVHRSTGDFACKIVSSDYNITSAGNTTIVVDIAQVTVAMTGIQLVKPTMVGQIPSKAIHLVRVNGYEVDNNSIVNFDQAVVIESNAIAGNYNRGAWNGTPENEVVVASGTIGHPFALGLMQVSKWAAITPYRTSPSATTIITGAVVATSQHLRVDTQSLGATDDLDTITLEGGRTPLHGEQIKVELTVTGRKPTLTTAGNMVGGILPLTLSSQSAFCILQWNQPTGKWVAIAGWSGV